MTGQVIGACERLRVDDAMSCASSRRMPLLAALFMTAMRLDRLLRS